MVTAIVRHWASPQCERGQMDCPRFRRFLEYEPLPFRALTTRGLNTGDRTAAASAFLRLNITPSFSLSPRYNRYLRLGRVVLQVSQKMCLGLNLFQPVFGVSGVTLAIGAYQQPISS